MKGAKKVATLHGLFTTVITLKFINKGQLTGEIERGKACYLSTHQPPPLSVFRGEERVILSRVGRGKNYPRTTDTRQGINFLIEIYGGLVYSGRTFVLYCCFLFTFPLSCDNVFMRFIINSETYFCLV